MSHKILRPFIVKVSVLGYLPLSSYTFLGVILDNNYNFKEHIRKIQLKLCYIYIKKAELFTNIYFKSTLQFFIFASYHVLFRHLGK